MPGFYFPECSCPGWNWSDRHHPEDRQVGYKVECLNKSFTQNLLLIKPVGFEGTAKEIIFRLNGRVFSTQIDDLNTDGFPDLLLFIYTDSNAVNGTVYCFISGQNRFIDYCILPDVIQNSKISKGYRGHDHFTLVEGTLYQQFPVYNSGDENNKPTGGSRVIQYRLINGEHGKYELGIRHFDDTK
jgi:hypothetical protein